MGTESNEQLVTNFFKRMSAYQHPQGQLVYSSDSDKRSVFYVKKGYLKSYFISNEGNYNILTIYGTGAIFPLGPMLRQHLGRTPYHLRETVHFETITDSQLIRTTSDELLNHCESKPIAYRELLTMLLANNELYLSRVEASMFRHAQERVAHQLIVLSGLYSSRVYDRLVIDVPLTHQDLANSLGMARETVSRELEKLRQFGLVDVKDRHIIINDLEALRKMLD